MSRTEAQATSADRLGQFLSDGADDELAEELAGWLASSRRFRAFADAHRDKIRKKLRSATDADARRDVRAELLVAHRLLADRRIELAFEADGSGKGGPDFSVALHSGRRCNVEVTRLRSLPTDKALAGTVLAKLRQLPPSVPNILVIAVEAGPAADIGDAMQVLRSLVDANDESFLISRGLAGRRAFHDRLRRLGAVIVWSETAAGDARAVAWRNNTARIGPPESLLRTCLATLRA